MDSQHQQLQEEHSPLADIPKQELCLLKALAPGVICCPNRLLSLQVLQEVRASPAAGFSQILHCQLPWWAWKCPHCKLTACVPSARMGLQGSPARVPVPAALSPAARQLRDSSCPQKCPVPTWSRQPPPTLLAKARAQTRLLLISGNDTPKTRALLAVAWGHQMP